ncbi:hypothetical protein C0989_004129 [Termitomyces sp. Mn162]|nr:hypothetical protein C0989_004129 [Termitomyces sp. Mn162]
MTRNWQYLATSKKSLQHASIPKEWILTNLPLSRELNVLTFPETCGLLTPNEIEITNTHVDVLLKKLANAEWSSVAVTTAFGKRAIVAHQVVSPTVFTHESRSEHGHVVLPSSVPFKPQTNCLTEIFIERALVRAAELDAHLKGTGTIIGPLHGLPISLKDQVSIKGIESTIGYASCVGQYAQCNAVLVDVLEALGAVLYVKTNIPQTLMATLKGSPLGVGSDVAGSIRIPSSFCGTYGFRPSTGRIPYAGSVNSLDGLETIPSILGPLSNSIHGLKMFIQGVLSQESWLRDPLVIRKSWSQELYNLVEHGGGKELCFGIMWNDGLLVPHPPIMRGLETAKNALIKAGHKVIDWKPLDHKSMLDIGLSIFRAGAAEDFAAVSAESGEPLITSMVPGKEITEIDPSMALIEAPLSAYELWQFQKKKRDLRQRHLEYWFATANQTGTGRPVDAIIAPVAPFTAVPHGKNS